MKLNIEPFRNWFGFTRKERSSSLILFIIIVLIIFSRFLVPDSNIAIEDDTATISESVISSDIVKGDISSAWQPYKSEPKKSPYNTQVKSEFASEEAVHSLKNRNKREQFSKPENNGKAPPTTLIDINLCDSSLLVRLPGIGPILSARIIKYRNLLGGFARTDQLKEVYGLSEETYNIIKDRLFADASAITRIYVNTADYKRLIRLPYFEKYEVNAILKYRELEGRLSSLSELIDNKLITEEKSVKVGPYLYFE